MIKLIDYLYSQVYYKKFMKKREFYSLDHYNIRRGIWISGTINWAKHFGEYEKK